MKRSPLKENRMHKNKTLKGVFAPVTTPFDENGDVNYEALRENILKYADAGLKGYLVLGSNGENKSLTKQEKLQVAETILKTRMETQTIMVTSIFESTRETIEFAHSAAELGADYITLLPPSYFKKNMTDKALLKYFTDVASSVDVPCLLYNAPQFAGGLSLSTTLIKECAAHPNIAGIKDSSSGNIEKILFSVPEGFAVLSGSANTLLPALFAGAAGGIIALANCLPEVAAELYEYVVADAWDKAVALNNRMVAANIGISGAYGVAGIKSAMDYCGYHGGKPRLPLLEISDKDKALIEDHIKPLI